MRVFLRFIALHFLAGLLFVGVFRDNLLEVVALIGGAFPGSIAFFLERAWWVPAIFLILFLFIPRSNLLPRVPEAFLAMLACSLFFLMFTVLKTSLPYVVPFYADPFFADFDRVLHFGIDPWRITHVFADFIPVALAEKIYTGLWLIPSMYLPVFLILFDADRKRIKRFLYLFLFAWAGIGNVLALAFMSAGPVFYDRLFGGDRFAPMMDALADAGVMESKVGGIYEMLWNTYYAGGQTIGSGISAFPSVHIAMVTVIALYLFERSKLLLPASIILVFIYIFLSVHFGWHYAIDGYFSVVLVFAYWVFLRRRVGTNPALHARAAE